MYEAIKKSMRKEMDALDQKLKGGVEMSVNDLDKIDKLAHAMKSLATYEAMTEYEDEDMNMSGRRGRGMNGQYVSRNGGRSYDDGYSRGYSEAMHRGMRYPMMYPPDGQNW